MPSRGGEDTEHLLERILDPGQESEHDNGSPSSRESAGRRRGERQRDGNGGRGTEGRERETGRQKEGERGREMGRERGRKREGEGEIERERGREREREGEKQKKHGDPSSDGANVL